MNKIHTHYDNLKVSRNAPDEVIRAAYRVLAQKYHPDRNQGDLDAARIMTLVNASYKVLSDPVERQKHDRWIEEQEFMAAQTDDAPKPSASAPPSPPPPPGNQRPAPEPVAPKPRPWIRFWARWFDILLVTFFSVAFLPDFAHGFFYPEDYFQFVNKPGGETLMGLASLFAWVFIEPFLLATFGTTPGKWLFNIRLVPPKKYGKPGAISPQTDKADYSTALSRSFDVWWRGLGMGLPLVYLFTMFFAYKKLENQGQTTWDKNGGFTVVHERLGVVKLVFAILFFMGCLVMALGAAGLATSQSVTSETTSHTPSSANSTERAQDEIEAKYRQVADQAVADYPELGDKDSKAFSMVSAIIHSNVQAGMRPHDALKAAVKSWAESEGRLPHQSATKQEPIKGAPQASANSKVAAESDLNTLNVDRFRDNGDDTVTDTKTGLQWKRCYEGQSLSNGICLGEPKKFSWYSAVKRFKKTSFAGKNDWRLPSIEELSTLVFCPKNTRTNLNACDGHYQRPTLNTKAFPSDYAPWVWSGSSRSSESVFAMYVYFGNGEEHWDPKNSAHTVRLVRSQ